MTVMYHYPFVFSRLKRVVELEMSFGDLLTSEAGASPRLPKRVVELDMSFSKLESTDEIDEKVADARPLKPVIEFETSLNEHPVSGEDGSEADSHSTSARRRFYDDGGSCFAFVIFNFLSPQMILRQKATPVLH